MNIHPKDGKIQLQTQVKEANMKMLSKNDKLPDILMITVLHERGQIIG